MSFDVVKWAREQKTGSPTRKAVLVAIAVYADQQGLAFPSQEQLAADTELSRHSVLRALDDLETAGLLTRTRRHRKDGSRTTDLISLNLSSTVQRSTEQRSTVAKPRSQRATARTTTELPPSAGPTNVQALPPPEQTALRPPDRDGKATQAAIELHRRVCELLGSDADPWRHEFGAVIGWVERGWTGYVVATIERVLKRRRGQLPTSWGYFTPAIADAAKEAAPLMPPAPIEAPKDYEIHLIKFRDAVAVARKRGLTALPAYAWPRKVLGPMPGESGCRVPIEDLRRHGFAA